MHRTASFSLLAAAVVLYAFDPAITSWFPSCPLRAWTGWLCPGCGTLRALHALLHGSVVEALRLNALTTTAAIGLAAAAVHDRIAPAQPWRRAAIDACLTASGAGIVAAFAVARNLF